MTRTNNLSRPIIEALYSEALLLADEVRAVFALGVPGSSAGAGEDTASTAAVTRGPRIVAEAGQSGQAGQTERATPEQLIDQTARLALSTEGLKTTTRMMHLLAWLLNQRAFFSGELSENQVRQHGTLPPDRPADPQALAALEPATCDLIEETERLHNRIARLDAAWRSGFEMASPVRAIHSRLERRLSDLN